MHALTHRIFSRARLLVAVFATVTTLFGGLVLVSSPAAAATRAFTTRFSTNAQGDIVYVANTLMTCPGSCAGVQNGTTVGSNNGFAMTYVNTASDGTTFNSSAADLDLPSGSTVLFARLYWGASSNNAARNQVRFRAPGAAGYSTLTAGQFDNNGADYQGSVDVTAVVASAGNGSYAVADVRANTGIGLYAGWAMVVAYADPNGVMRNLTVFDGYSVVSTGSQPTINVSGFLTPPVGPVNTKLGVIAYEGDLGFGGDQLLLNGVAMGDARNPTNNFFNSTISANQANVTSRNPPHVNQLGYDADIISVPNTGNTLLANSATSAAIRLTTTGDVYYPGVVSFVTDLYAPKMKVDKRAEDVNGGDPRPGDVLEYTLTVSNTGKDPAINVVLTDAIPANTTYVPNSLRIVSGTGAGTKTDAQDADTADFNGSRVRYNLGTGATGTAGGQMNENDEIVLAFRVAIDATAPDNVPIPNTAALAFTALTLGTASIAPSVVVPVVATNKADLAISKTDDATEETPGTSTDYTIVVSNTNASNNRIENAIVEDLLPATLTNATWTCVASAGGNCDVASGNGSISTTVDLAVGATATFRVTATIDPNAVGTLTNTATVTPAGGVTDLNPADNAATDTTALSPRGDLALTKTDSATSEVPGTTATYTIVATNSGPSSVTGATVSDSPPSAVSGSITWTCAASPGSVCPASGSGNLNEIVDLAPAGTATFLLTYTIDAAATGSLVNTATLTPPAVFTDTDSANNAPSDTNTLTPESRIAVGKRHDPAVIRPGEPTTYTISVVNSGPSVAPTATLTDTLPSNFTVSSVSSGAWTCNQSGSTLNCDTTKLAVGTTTVTVIGTYAATSTGVGTNAVSVTSPTDPDTSDNVATDATTLSPTADFSIVKSHQPSSPVAGSTVTYVLDVNQAGPSAAVDAVVVDTLPPGITPMSVTATPGSPWSCVIAGQTVTCTAASVSPGTSSIRIEASISATATGSFDNTATVSTQTSDPDGGDTTSTDSFTVTRQADLRISKVANGTFVAGTPVSWTIRVTNNGPSAVTDALISDTSAPAQVSNYSWTCPLCVSAAGVGLPVNVGVSLAPGATATLTLTGTLSATPGTDPILNSASVAAPAGVADPDLGNNSVTDSARPTARADVSISKSNGQASLVPGLPVTYRIVAANAGPSTVSTTVNDTVPAAILSASWTCVATGGASCAPGGSGNIADAVTLPAGSTATYTLTGTVSPTATGSLTNTAQIGATVPPNVDSDASNNSATDVDVLVPIVDLSIAKRGNPASVAGEDATWTIEVRNSGPSTATDAVINDSLPSGLTLTNLVCAPTGGATCGSGTAFPVTASLPPNSLVTYTVTTSVAPGASAGLVKNAASVATPDGVTEADSSDNTATAETVVERRVNLAVTKTNGTDAVNAGAATTYRVRVTNTGVSQASGVQVTDAMPAAASVMTWTCAATDATCAATSGTGAVITTADIAPGGFVEYTIQLTVDPGARGQLINTASIVPPPDSIDASLTDNAATDTDTISAQTVLTISKTSTADPGAIAAGSSIGYNIVVSNTGLASAPGTQVTDSLPAELQNATWSCTGTNGASCPASGIGSISTLVDLPPSSSATFTVAATVDPAARGTVVNTAAVSYPDGVTPVSGPSIIPSTSNVAISATADLRVVKSNAQTEAVPGRPVTYVITVTNDGPATVNGVTITDPIPSALLNASWSCAASAGAACAAGGGTGSINSTANLAAGTSVTYTLSGVVDPFAAVTSATITNTASALVPGDTTEVNPANNGAADQDTLTPVADLAVTKTDGATQAVPGSAIEYSIVATNAGPSAVQNARLVDVLPASLTSSSTGVTWSCATFGAFNECVTGSGASSPVDTLVNLAPGASVTVTLRARIDPSARGELNNSASFAGPIGTIDPDPTNNSATDTNTLTPIADLSVSKTHSGVMVPGTRGTWTIRAANAGPSTSSATVVDVLPTGVSNVTWTCAASAGSSCPTAGAGSLGAALMLPGGSVEYTLTADIDPALEGTVTNRATIQGPNDVTDPETSNNEASHGAPLQPTADLKIAKVRVDDLVPGQPVAYRITVTNDGPSSATGARVLDTVPEVLRNVAWTCSAVTGTARCGAGSGTGDIDALVDLSPRSSVVFVLTADVPETATGAIVNTAQLLPPTGLTDPDVSNNQSSDSGVAQPRADLSITKTDGAASAVPGELITYTVIARNAGPSAVPGARVVDLLPGALADASWTCIASTGSSCGSSTGLGDIDSQVSLASLGTAAFTITATINPAERGLLVNIATLRVPSGVIDPEPGNNTATDSNTLVPTADLRVAKRHVGPLVPGSPAQWVVEVANLGPSSVEGARITDTLPATVLAAEWTCSVAATSGNMCTDQTGTGNIDTTVDLTVGSVATFTIDASLSETARGSLSNTATAEVPAAFADPNPSNNSFTDVGSLRPTSDLSIRKSHTGSLIPGRPVTYELVVSNDGPSSAENVRIADALDPVLTNASWTCAGSAGAGCVTGSGSGDVSVLANFPANSSVTITLTADISPSALGTLSNTATVSLPSGWTDPDATDRSATDAAPLTPQVDLSVIKSHSGPIVSGENVTYTIRVENAGPSDILGAPVTDSLPASLTNASWSCVATNGSCPTSGSGSIATGVDLRSGGFALFTLVTTVDPTATGVVSNTAMVAAPFGVVDTDGSNNVSTDSTGSQQQVDLVVTKSHSGTFIPGEPVSWRITVANEGPSAVVGASVRDALPSSIESPAWNCSVPSGVANACAAAAGVGSINTTVNLAPGATSVFVVTGTLRSDASGTLSNTVIASVPGGVSELSGANNEATDAAPTAPTANLSVSKTHTGTIVAGGPSRHSITVRNAGPSDVSNARIRDSIPASFTSVSWTCALVTTGVGNCDDIAGTGNNINSTVDLPAGASAVFTIDATLASGSTDFANTATVTPPSGVIDPDPSGNNDTDSGIPERQVDLSVAKSVVGALVAGRPATFEIVVTNTGPSDALNTNVTDVLPAGLSAGRWSCTANGTSTCASSTGTGDLNTTVTVTNGSSVRFVVTANLDPNYRGSLTNTASASASLGTVELDLENNDASVTAPVQAIADATVTKRATSRLVPGTQVTYEIAVTNSGPSTLTDATILDRIPAGLSGANWICAVSEPTTGSFSNSCLVGAGSGDLSTSVNLGVGASALVVVTALLDPSERATSAAGRFANAVSLELPGDISDSNSEDNAAETSDPVEPEIALKIAKRRLGNLVPGQLASYEIVVTNAGPSSALGASIVDQLPSALSNANWTCAGSGATCATDAGTGDINTTANLLPGGSVTYLVSARISTSARGALSNTASVISVQGEVESAPGDEASTDSGTLTPIADLVVTKTHDAQITPGGVTTWTISIANAGPSSVVGASVIDTLPSDVSNATWTCEVSFGGLNACGERDGTGSINTTVSLAAGGTATYRLSGLVSPRARADVINTASVAPPADTTDPDPGSNTSVDSGAPIPTADLSITKTHTGAVTPGGSVVYTITARNDGPSAVDNARVLDALPGALRNATWTCAGASGSACDSATGTGSIDTTVDLDSGGSATFTLRADVDPSAIGNVSNRAAILAPPGVIDPQSSNDVAIDDARPLPVADVRLEKRLLAAAPLRPGIPVTYQLVVTNAGPSAARGVVISDPLAAYFVSPTWSCVATTGSSCPARGVGAPSVVADVLPGGSVTVSLVVAVSSSHQGEVVNQASVANPRGVRDPDLTNNTATVRSTAALEFVPIPPVDPTGTTSTPEVRTSSSNSVPPQDAGSTDASGSVDSSANSPTVSTPSSVPVTPTQPDEVVNVGNLSLTGGQVGGLAAIAALLVAAGFALLIATRRRHAGDHSR
jgi:uncharacterized repeat protein (TIGR01451 family)